ncbi:hypothetical protein J8J14_10430 [Roseomonas sp. SSH11]|uniref:Uncharacterized protein n=1 Tax=Pararoseomonas baculiformis TaxID=2820812 RepID=A0ABS4AEC1_9PROT|nr:hypothetical protein [Pararoseomonas baculiformis]MBP0445196.1 hypothetical protein [Pararoseomonas baculiformis]
MIESFLLGAGGTGRDPLASEGLRVGALLDLHPNGRSGVEVRAQDGRPLGRLPSEDAQLVAELLGQGAIASARVRGLIPAFGRSRVQIAIEVEAKAARHQSLGDAPYGRSGFHDTGDEFLAAGIFECGPPCGTRA